MTARSIRMPATLSRDPLVLVPGGPTIPWPPQEGRFTDEAKRALGFAQDEAARFNHNHVGPVHIFVGLVRENEGLPARIFADLGVTLDRARDALTSIMGRSEAPTAESDITLIPRAQRVMDIAKYESRRMAHPVTGSEHLLLAVVRDGDGMTSRVIESLGLDLKDVRARILQELHVPPSYGAADNATPSHGPYDRFDDASKRTLGFAQEEAARMGHDWVGGEHLVLGLAHITEVLASDDAVRRVFSELNLTLEQLRREVARIQPPRQSPGSPSDVKFTGATKLIIELAIHEAGPDKAVRPQHILLAIGAAHDALGGYALAQLGATPERVRAIVNRR